MINYLVVGFFVSLLWIHYLVNQTGGYERYLKTNFADFSANFALATLMMFISIVMWPIVLICIFVHKLFNGNGSNQNGL